MKWIRHIIFSAVLLLLAILLITSYNPLPSFRNLLQSKPVVIENTPVVVKQIKAIAQLITISAYEELVADSSVTQTRTIHLPLLPDIELSGTTRKLVLIGKVTTHIGIDMQQLTDADISGTPDSIHIILPAAQILDAIINPSDVEVFIEQGEWENTAVASLKNKMRYLAQSNAISKGLLAQSEQKAIEVVSNFFKAAGYRQVVIQFRSSPIQMQ